jgi:hypothetical protein
VGRIVAMLCLLTGCDFIWRLDHLPPPDGPPPCQATDDFTGDRLASHWSEFTGNTLFAIRQEDALVLDLSGGAGASAGEAGVRYVTAFDRTGGSVEVEVPSVVAADPFVENYLRVRAENDNDHTYVIRYGDEKIDFRTRVGVDTIHRSRTYNALTDRFWRIWNGPTPGEVTFSTRGSVDEPWFDETTQPAAVSFARVEIFLVAGMFGISANPGAATYDNFKICGARAL